MDTFNSNYDECQQNLERLIEYYQDNLDKLNESDTRLRIIDTLLFDCLGWKKQDVFTEEYQRTEHKEYTDYTFFAPRRMMILEAKRAGETFIIPAGKVAHTFTIKSLCQGNTALKAAIDQVSGYCQKRGVPIAAVCNGHQLVTFVANRNDGVAPMDGKAFVFNSLQLMLKEFATFWEMLSRQGIEDNKLQRHLLGAHRPELPLPLSASITDYPGTKGRNVFQAELKSITELVVEDVPESTNLSQEFLRKCYCHSGALSQHSLASKAILRARYAAMFDQSSPDRPSLTPATTQKGVSAELYAESMSRRPILLLGNVGVGKSIFIRYLIEVDAVDQFRKAICLRIDLGFGATLTSDLKEFVVNQITDQLATKYSTRTDYAEFVRKVYAAELRDYRKTIHGEIADSNPTEYANKERQLLEVKVANTSEHSRRSLEYLSKEQKKQIVIFIDNADQRLDATQDEAFLIAQEIAAKWPALVYVPLRPETFHRSVEHGALSGYHPKAFTVSPPRVDRVLEKRLQYALEIADKLAQSKPNEKGTVEGLKTIIKSFLKTIHHTDEVIECVDNISGGNIRLALTLVKQFFGSGHVNTQKIVEAVKENGFLYEVPLHEFLRACIYGDCVYYSPERSLPIANLLDVSFKDSKEHFLLPILLGILRQAGQTNQGFVDTEDAYSALQGLGFVPEQIDFAIVRAFRKKLVETPAAQKPEKDAVYPRRLRATTVGLYHLDRLMSSFVYIDAVSVVTPIFDDDVRALILDIHLILERIDRCKKFQAYLDTQWKDASFGNLSFDWPTVSAALTKDIEVAELKATSPKPKWRRKRKRRNQS
ncbi:MAG: hypothetical protein AB7I57_01440 [Pirellulales bacterium]